MKAAREKIREVLELEGEINQLVIVFRRRGHRAGEFKHNFERKAQALAFVSETLRLSNEEFLGMLSGRDL